MGGAGLEGAGDRGEDGGESGGSVGAELFKDRWLGVSGGCGCGVGLRGDDEGVVGTVGWDAPVGLGGGWEEVDVFARAW